MIRGKRQTRDTFKYPHPRTGVADAIEIEFLNGAFHQCSYSLGTAVYSRDDWRILGAISEEITLLEEEFEKQKSKLAEVAKSGTEQ